ncbi:MAG: DUF4115 domain-containing protein [Elainella sp. Prado103]|jgi:cytoskeletal protein RodZ|nr:DUF4115 domain-containing protein [Elainella sp. Prado103]
MGTLDTVQQEQLEAIGTYLSQVREGQARSLEEISAKTYIPMRLLKAIELGQGKTLPEPVFIQGFIRRYADALGLDGIDLSQKFPVTVTPLPVMTAPTPTRSNSPKPNSSFSRELKTKEANQASSLSQPEELESNSRSRTLLPYIAAAGLLALGGIALAVVQNISARQPTTPKQAVVLPPQPSPVDTATPSPAAVSSSPGVSPAPATRTSPSPQAEVNAAASSTRPNARPNATNQTPNAASASSPTPSPSSTAPTPQLSRSTSNPNAPVNVELQTTDEAWVQVIVDGQVKTEAVLPSGTRQTWTGNREVIVISGNAGAVSVIHNGRSPKPLGARGAVSEMTFKPEPKPN